MSDEITAEIKQQLADNTVVLYMKGSPHFPQCGFSAKVSHMLLQLNTKFVFVNILDRQDIRAALPIYANWPTFPQVYINAELIGGCDIVTDLFSNGELQTKLAAADAIVERPEFSSL